MSLRVALLALLIASPAAAQSVQQSGTVTRGHVAVWNTSGVIADGGSSSSSPITSLGVTNNGGCGIGINSALPTAGAYEQLCFGINAAGTAVISAQSYSGAPTPSITFNINGTAQGFPVVTPLPVVIGDIACFSAVGGTLTDCGFPPSGSPLVIGTTPITGGTTNNLLYDNGGVLGNTAALPNGITATTQSVGDNTLKVATDAFVKNQIAAGAGPLIIGTTTITGGIPNGLLFDNAGTVGNLATAANGFLVTNGSGVPSISSTLPSGLIIPSPTIDTQITWTYSGTSVGVQAIGNPAAVGPVGSFITTWTGSNVGTTTALHVLPASGPLVSSTTTEIVTGTTPGQAFGGNYGRWSYSNFFSTASGIVGEYGGTVTPPFYGLQIGIENPPSVFTSIEFWRAQTVSTGAEDSQQGAMLFGANQPSPGTIQNRIVLIKPNIGSAGQRDSDAIAWEGKANNGTDLGVLWRAYVDVTSNAGASTYTWQSNLNGAGWNTRATLTDGGLFTVANVALTASVPSVAGALGYTAGVPTWYDGANAHNFLGADVTQTVTNKTISGASNTLTVLAGTQLSGQVPVANGGTNCASASGTCLDNITGFSSTGLMQRTGAGTYSFTTPGTGVITFLGTPSSANLAAALTDETGTGVAVFGTSPILSTVDARGTWTTGTSWTLPAHTLGGTITGGGNQLNAVVIGTSTFDTASNTFKANGKTITSLIQALSFASGGALSQATTYFMGPAGAQGTEALGQGLCPFAGTFRNLYLLTGAIGGTAQTVTATMRTGGSSGALTCTVSTGSTTCNDTTHTTTCTAGQSFDVQVALSATTGSVSVVTVGVELDNP